MASVSIHGPGNFCFAIPGLKPGVIQIQLLGSCLKKYVVLTRLISYSEISLQHIIFFVLLLRSIFFSQFCLGQVAFGKFAAIAARWRFGAGCCNFFVYNQVACRGSNSAEDEEASGGTEKIFSVHNTYIYLACVSNHGPGCVGSYIPGLKPGVIRIEPIQGFLC